MVEEQTERVTMVWPRDLKNRVRDAAGKRGMTEFVAEATEVALNGGAKHLRDLEVELNSTKHLVQLLADRLVMGGEPEDRLQALMELELPHWIDTTGWPAPMAELVKPEAAEPPTETPPPVPATPEPGEGPNPTPEPEPEPEPAPPAPEPEPAADLPHDKQGDPFYDRIMAKAGDKLKDIPGLQVASSIPKPEPKPEPEATESDQAEEARNAQAEEAIQVMEEVVEVATASNTCPNCGEELVDGECWTCG